MTATTRTKSPPGKLLTIDNQIDTTTGTYKLKAVFDNSKNELFPNQFVNVHLLVDTKKNVVLVPTTAILRGSQGTYVYAVNAQNAVAVKNVTVAQTHRQRCRDLYGFGGRRCRGYRRPG